MPTINGVTVIVCCYNSAKRLPETMSYLARQNNPEKYKVEIVIVDNCSTDDTVIVAEKVKTLFPPGFFIQIVSESRPGLNYAREKGIAVSTCEYLLFCDDDNWLCPDYIDVCYKHMNAFPQTGVIGGKGIAKCEVKEPEWFNKFSRQYAIGSPAHESGYLKSIEQFLTGAGMFLRKAAWQTLRDAGFTSKTLDRKGKSLSSGGDLEICLALRIAGYDLYYNDSIFYYHFIPQERLTLDYLTKLHAGLGKSNVILDAYKYVLNGLTRNKSNIWLRIVSQLFPKYVQTHFYYPVDISNKMNVVLFRAYYKELLRINFIFDRTINEIENLKLNIDNKKSVSVMNSLR